MLCGLEFLQGQRLPFLEIGQYGVFRFTASRRLHPGVAIEADNAALRAHEVIARCRGDHGGRVFRIRHLAGHELAPDHFIESLCITLHTLERGLRYVNVGRTDRLVRLLGTLFRGIATRRVWQVARREVVANVVTTGRHGFVAEVGGVCTHVSDVARLVQALGQHHRLFHAETEPRARRLLQCRGDKRCRRLGPGRLVLALRNRVAGGLQLITSGHRRRFIARSELVVAVLVHLEAYGLTRRGLEIGVNLPVFFRHEGANFTFALHDKAHGDRLNTPGRQSPRNLGPQQGRHHIAHYAVQEAPRLLGVNAVHIELCGLFERLGDGLLGDFVEYNTLVAGVVTTDGLAQVPGYRLPLAVEVSSEIDMIRVRRQLLQLTDDLFLSGQYLVVGFPTFLRVDTHPADKLLTGLLLFMRRLFCRRHLARLGRLCGPLLRVDLTGRAARGRQVADMPNAGLHHKVLTKVLIDRLGLGWGFHNDERFTHTFP